MSYTPNTWTTGDTITATKLNNIEQGIAESSGGGWDFVFEYSLLTHTCTLVSGDILAAEDKVDNGELVYGICMLTSEWSWTPSGANTNKTLFIIPLTYFEPPYTALHFCGVYYDEAYYAVSVDLSYDPDNGEITNASYNSSQV